MDSVLTIQEPTSRRAQTSTMAKAASIPSDHSRTDDVHRHDKRLLAQETAHTNKRLKTSTNHPKAGKAASPLESLPAELFCQVLSFVGPTSSSLVALAEVNKYMNSAMTAIGNAMLPRARSNFRAPLEHLSLTESCTSLFVRHARTCSAVLNKLTHLRQLLLTQSNDNMEEAMGMALRLLEIGPTLSESLERQILATCGKCGGKAFKHCKYVLLHSQSQASPDTAPGALQERQARDAKHQERLDMAQLIMQIVVFRDLQLSKQSNLTTLVQTNMKKVPSMGCF